MCLVAQSCPTLCDPMNCNPPGSFVHGIIQARILSGLSCPPPGALPNPGTDPRSPASQADSLASEPLGKPHNLSCSSQICLLYNEICSTCMLSCFSCVWLLATIWTITHLDSPGKNTGVHSHSLLQEIFLTQGSNLNLLWLLHWRQILNHWATKKPILYTEVVTELMRSQLCEDLEGQTSQCNA